jgi:hypothetical protein
VINQEGKEYIINLRDKTYTYMRFQEYEGPCSHAIIAARIAFINPYTLFSHKYKLHVYRLTYQEFTALILSEGLIIKEGLLPPLIMRRRGRP